MKILLTGISGFIGKYLARQWQRTNNHVIGVTRSPADPLLTIEVRYADLSEGIPIHESVDVIVHAAAQSPAEGVTLDDFISSNIESVRNLIYYAQTYKVKKFIFLSSLSLYGKVLQPVVNEESPRIDPDVYGVTKFIGEQLLRDQESWLSSAALRLPGVVGPEARTPWLTRTAQRLLGGKPVEIYNPQALFNNVVHVSDLEAFIRYLLAQDWKGMRCFTLGTIEPLTIKQTVDLLREKLNSTSVIKESPSPGRSFIVDVEKAMSFGYSPMTTEHALSKYSEDLLEITEEETGKVV